MADAKVIDLFTREPVNREDAMWVQWGREFVEDGVNRLVSIITEIENCTTEDELRACLRELKEEVANIPDL